MPPFSQNPSTIVSAFPLYAEISRDFTILLVLDIYVPGPVLTKGVPQICEAWSPT